MPLIKMKPTSAGRRGVVRASTPGLHKGRPLDKLVEPQANRAGRNANGRITVRHRGGGHKQHYRIVDFKRRDKDGIAGNVERLEYDPNRSANLALVCYADGERRYIIAAKGLTVGAQVMSGPDAPIKLGNVKALRNIPVGTTIHCVELQPGKGAQIAAPRGPRSSFLRARATTPRSACGPAKSARCTSSAGRRSARSATRSTT